MLVVFGIGQCAAGLVELVLGVQQVQQRALTDIELLLICLARFGRGELVLCQQRDLAGQAFGVVVGNLAGLPDVAASLVPQVKCTVEFREVLFGTRPVRATPEQVVVQHQFQR